MRVGNARPSDNAMLRTTLGAVMISFSAVWDVVFFDRHTSTMAWVGVALSLAAIYRGATSGQKAPRSLQYCRQDKYLV